MTGITISRPETPSLHDMAARQQARAILVPQVLPAVNPQSLDALQTAIYAGHLIVGNKDGTWHARHRITQIVFCILDAVFGTSFVKQQDLQLALFFENYLKSFEVKNSDFKKGIGLDSKNTAMIDRAKVAVISRLKTHKALEQRTIHATLKINDKKIEKSLQQLIDERKVLREQHEQCLHKLANVKPPRKQNSRKAATHKAPDLSEVLPLEKKLFELDTLIRDAREKAFASSSIFRIERQALAIETRKVDQASIYDKKKLTNDVKVRSQSDERWMRDDLLAWKNELADDKDKEGKDKIPTPNTVRMLTSRDKEKILLTCFFPEFIKLLREDAQIREEYYKFVFRNTADGGKDAADIAIQLPVHQKRLMKCMLDKREGRLNDLFKLDKTEVHTDGESRSSLRKFVSIKIEGQECDIFDHKKVITFDANTPYKISRTVGEVFSSFAKKNVEMGEYETIQSKGIVRLHGIMNADFAEPQEELSLMHTVGRAIYNFFFEHVHRPLPVVDLQKPNWQTQMKPLESLSYDEVIARYGVEPQHALIVARATRGQPLDQQDTVMVDNSHSFLELVVPNDDDNFDVFPIGKYAFPWPSSTLDTLLYIFKTQRGIIRCDENSFYNHRHQAAYPMQASEDQVRRFWEKIRRDLVKERNNEIIFQAQGDNCSKWAEDTLDYVYQNPTRARLYAISYLQGSAPGPVGYIISFIQFVARVISATAGNIIRLAIGIFLGSWRGYTTGPEGEGPTHRLITDPTYRSEKLMLPGTLFQARLKDSEENMKGYFALKIRRDNPIAAA